MNDVFIACTIVGGLIILVNMLMCGDDDWISIGTLGHFLTGFGSMGIIFAESGLTGQEIYGGAFGAGCVLAIFCHWLIRKLHRTGNAGIDEINFSDMEAMTVLPIEPRKPGEISVIVDMRKNYFFRALAKENIAAGKRVRVVSVKGNTAIVESINK